MTSAPRVSVVVPFFNAERFLEEAIESVLVQTYRGWDLWLVDDGSRDGSTAMAQRFASRHPDRIRYLEHAGHGNRGAAASRNAGIRASRGELVALLDADDVWLEHKLQEQVEILDAHRHVSMVYGRSLYWHSWAPPSADAKADFDFDMGVEPETVHRPPDLALRCYPLGTAPTPCPSDILLRRSALDPAGAFEEAFHGIYQLYEDQAFLAKIFLTEAVYVSSKCWDRYRVHDDSCVTTVNAQNHYHTVRRYYFEWLARYLDRHGIANAEIRAALARAQKQYEAQYEPSVIRRFAARLKRRIGGR
jgi:glycosyltransferase involved in cell wall biosynthesis